MVHIVLFPTVFLLQQDFECWDWDEEQYREWGEEEREEEVEGRQWGEGEGRKDSPGGHQEEVGSNFWQEKSS